MRALDRKLFRDLRRLWAQALAIALVIAGGVATLVLAVGSFRSLEETRNAYYERYRFADVFATVRRAPKTLLSQITELPGVAAADARIAKLALLDLREPATGRFISLPDIAKPTLNQLYIRVGRTPEALSPDEVVVSEGFRQGARVHAGLEVLGNPQRPQAPAHHCRHRAVAGVHLHGRPGRHHAGRPPLRHRLDVGEGARQRL
jgi:putative ABC transport system permease protein